MSSVSMKLSARDAKRLAKEIVENGTVDITSHAWEDLEQHDMTAGDVFNIMCGGAWTEAEFENGGWRHQAFTQKYAVVVEFNSDTHCVVVTGFSLVKR